MSCIRVNLPLLGQTKFSLYLVDRQQALTLIILMEDMQDFLFLLHITFQFVFVLFINLQGLLHHHLFNLGISWELDFIALNSIVLSQSVLQVGCIMQNL